MFSVLGLKLKIQEKNKSKYTRTQGFSAAKTTTERCNINVRGKLRAQVKFLAQINIFMW